MSAASGSRSRRSRAALPQVPPPPPVPCPRCSRTCTVIRLTGQEGVALTLHSCHFCEHRWWTRQGEGASGQPAEAIVAATDLQEQFPGSARLVGLTEVLEATRVDRDLQRHLPHPA